MNKDFLSDYPWTYSIVSEIYRKQRIYVIYSLTLTEYSSGRFENLRELSYIKKYDDPYPLLVRIELNFKGLWIGNIILKKCYA